VNCYKQYATGSVDQFVIPMPGTRALLKALRARGIPYAILTNGWSPLQEVKAARVGFDGPVVVSETIGVQKPQAAAFDALIAALGTDRSQVWYVGDTPATDVAGSIACGLKSVWFDAESVPFPENIAKPSAVIHSLDELPAVLETYRGSAALT
jgi:putative hydrolase of the HAD superfamily